MDWTKITDKQPNRSQPDRSKREDLKFVFINPVTGKREPVRFLEFNEGCGAQNIAEMQ